MCTHRCTIAQSVRFEWDEHMPRRKQIRRSAVDDVKARRARGTTRTHATAPVREIDAAFWKTARVILPSPGKASIHLRVDRDVLEWFRHQGRGHLSRMN